MDEQNQASVRNQSSGRSNNNLSLENLNNLNTAGDGSDIIVLPLFQN